MFVNNENVNEIVEFLAKNIEDEYFIFNTEYPDWWIEFCRQTKTVPMKNMSQQLMEQVILYYANCQRTDR